MIELLDYLTDNGFDAYIASGGGRDFIRPISQELYHIPHERVVGSSLGYTSSENGGTITHQHHPVRPTLRLLIEHDDPEREFDYTKGAERALSRADTDVWTVVSITNWDTVFPD